MIFILDNGLCYSDHQIIFLESDLPKEQMEKIIKEFFCYEILGTAEEISWYEGGTMSLEDHFCWSSFIEWENNKPRPISKDKIDLLPENIVRRSIDKEQVKNVLDKDAKDNFEKCFDEILAYLDSK